MKIIAHRGAWSGDLSTGVPIFEKNSKDAFLCATQYGFGIETDFRDMAGEVVISHNPPEGGEMLASEFFSSLPTDVLVALNIKADGIASKLSQLIVDWNPKTQSFVFDMSVPDTLDYEKRNIQFFERKSEFEEAFVWESAKGYWLDGFKSEWYSKEYVEMLIRTKRFVCIVSPELHGRPYYGLWEKLQELFVSNKKYSNNIYLCTDYPFEAKRYFKDFV